MEQKIREILNYVHGWGNDYSEWYCGITADPKDRLFNKHKVFEKGVWLYMAVENSEIARNIEKYLLENLGFEGGPGGGDYSAVFVYVYKKNANTIE